MGPKQYDKIFGIAITLGEKEYHPTFKPLLETVYKAVDLWCPDRLVTDYNKITDSIYAGIEYHYVVFQTMWAASDQKSEEVAKYLRGKIKVLYNEEAHNSYERQCWSKGSWYMEMKNGMVFSY